MRAVCAPDKDFFPYEVWWNFHIVQHFELWRVSMSCFVQVRPHKEKGGRKSEAQGFSPHLNQSCVMKNKCKILFFNLKLILPAEEHKLKNLKKI